MLQSLDIGKKLIRQVELASTSRRVSRTNCVVKFASQITYSKKPNCSVSCELSKNLYGVNQWWMMDTCVRVLKLLVYETFSYYCSHLDARFLDEAMHNRRRRTHTTSRAPTPQQHESRPRIGTHPSRFLVLFCSNRFYEPRTPPSAPRLPHPVMDSRMMSSYSISSSPLFRLALAKLPRMLTKPDRNKRL